MWYGGTLTMTASSSSAPANSTVVDDVRRQVAVAQHGGLRLAGRAARVEQHGDGVRVAGVGIGQLDRLVDDELEELLAADQLDARRSAPRRSAMPSPTITVAGAVRRTRSRSCSSVEPVVDRHERLAGQRGAEQRDRHGLGVQVDERHPLTGSLRRRPCRPAAARVGQLGHRHAAVERPERDAVAHAVGGHLQQHPQVHQKTLADPSRSSRKLPASPASPLVRPRVRPDHHQVDSCATDRITEPQALPVPASVHRFWPTMLLVRPPPTWPDRTPDLLTAIHPVGRAETRPDAKDLPSANAGTGTGTGAPGAENRRRPDDQLVGGPPMPWRMRSQSSSASAGTGVPPMVDEKRLNMIASRTNPIGGALAEVAASDAGGRRLVEDVAEQVDHRGERPGGFGRVGGEQLLCEVDHDGHRHVLAVDGGGGLSPSPRRGASGAPAGTDPAVLDHEQV